MIFLISADNNITTHDVAPEAAEGVVTFTSQKELAAASKDWPTGRFIDIWNAMAGLPGPFASLKPVKKFTDRKTAINRIWNIIAALVPKDGQPAGAPQVAPNAPDTAAAPKAASPKKDAAKAKKAAKEPKPAKTAKAKPAKEAADRTARAGTMKATVIAMLQRKGGATLQEIMKITAWQPHTVRGFISILGSKGGMKIESSKRDDGARLYTAAK